MTYNIKPSEVYGANTKPAIENLLAGTFKVIDFRPPKAGETFVTDMLTIMSAPSNGFSSPPPRLIVVSNKENDWWE